MKKIFGLSLLALLSLVALTPLLVSVTFAKPKYTWDTNPKHYEHGIAVDLGDGTEWYFAGPGSEMGVTDVPGHTWKQTGPYRVKGLHYNVGPSPAAGMPWWATGEPYGALLFVVDGRIAPWTYEIANKMVKKGYVHYHELVDSTGDEHPNLVVWLKHTAVTDFYFDGGPRPDLGHPVTKGVDYLFMPNYFMPYSP